MKWVPQGLSYVCACCPKASFLIVASPFSPQLLHQHAHRNHIVTNDIMHHRFIVVYFRTRAPLSSDPVSQEGPARVTSTSQIYCAMDGAVLGTTVEGYIIPLFVKGFHFPSTTSSTTTHPYNLHLSQITTRTSTQACLFSRRTTTFVLSLSLHMCGALLIFIMSPSPELIEARERLRCRRQHPRRLHNGFRYQHRHRFHRS